VPEHARDEQHGKHEQDDTCKRASLGHRERGQLHVIHCVGTTVTGMCRLLNIG
jgi:hypothetical protein